jgi:uncharacterized membrane protein YgdD (TMEM256/DUF423 family)
MQRITRKHFKTLLVPRRTPRVCRKRSIHRKASGNPKTARLTEAMRTYLYLAGIAGVAGVSAGAFGAHALKDDLVARATLSTWNTAVLYNLIHALALLAAGLHSSENRARSAFLANANACWAAGILLFSGSLYWLSLGGPRWLGPITPLGGVFLILGWGFVLLHARKLTTGK